MPTRRTGVLLVSERDDAVITKAAPAPMMKKPMPTSQYGVPWRQANIVRNARKINP